ncbi:MAG: hypothetical protein EPN82_05660 [Bacteroidetes bacterium]|nr:MAG: hypothetical protein EPN82_05660 [Bacteroidota bacterium]
MNSTLNDLSGNNSDIRQQVIISKLIISIKRQLETLHKHKTIVTSESDILFYNNTRELQRRNADIVIWKYSDEELKGIMNPLLIIELTNNKFPQDIFNTHNQDFIKANEYLDYIESLREYILYNYENKEIIKFSKNRKKEFDITYNNFHSNYLDKNLKQSLALDFPELNYDD